MFFSSDFIFWVSCICHWIGVPTIQYEHYNVVCANERFRFDWFVRVIEPYSYTHHFCTHNFLVHSIDNHSVSNRNEYNTRKKKCNLSWNSFTFSRSTKYLLLMMLLLVGIFFLTKIYRNIKIEMANTKIAAQSYVNKVWYDF